MTTDPPRDYFQSAEPIFARELSGVMNAAFVATGTFSYASGTATLTLAAHSIYRCRVNGRFVAAGPARTAHGHARVDDLDLTPFCYPGQNTLTLEVVAYHIPTFSHANDPGFLQAEVTVSGKAVLHTSATDPGFTLTTIPHRPTEVRRYSFQRAFSEHYDLKAFPPQLLTTVRRSPRRLLPRRVPLPRFDVSHFTTLAATGHFSAKIITPEKSYWWETRPPELCRQYPRESWAANPHHTVSYATYTPDAGPDTPVPSPLILPPSRYAVLALPSELTGFLRLRVRVNVSTLLAASFDELLPPAGHLNVRRSDCVNTISWQLPPGEHDLESIEPNSMKFLQLQCLSGHAEVLASELRRFEYPLPQLTAPTTDPDRLAVFRAAADTFAQNSVDYFVDCPSRERAGWLCDSYFTSRASILLTGNLDLETAFLENYLLSPPDAHLPEGMLPMCYPGDHPDGNFIPQWALWLILQLREYRQRGGGGGDAELIARFQPRIEKLLAFFSRFERADGVLRGLPGWSFIEWSKANDFQKDLNYPSSFLYGAALIAAADLYANEAHRTHGQAVISAAAAESFNGTFFVDNATLAGETYAPTSNTTEVAQYYAFYFGAASPKSHPQLWDTLVKDFGPRRAATNLHPLVYPANMLVGIMLRLDLLSQHGLHDQALSELTEYLLPMARTTGTLWEHNNPSASCNHGFASYAAALLLAPKLAAVPSAT